MTLRAAVLTGFLLASTPLAASRLPPTSLLAPALALQGMPQVRQAYNDCGPASIAMVLGYYGFRVPVSQISQATKLNQVAYMQVDQVRRYVAPFGLEATTFAGGQPEHLKRLIRLGVPVIALQYLRGVGDVAHFRVVSGFDDRRTLFYLNDPLLGYASVSYHNFDTLWNTQGRLFVAVYPPAQRLAIMRALGVPG